MSRVFARAWEDYELLDAGDSAKLERWGKIITIRPDRNAYFKPGWPRAEWVRLAHFEFREKSAQSGEWIPLKRDFPSEWQIGFSNIRLNLKLTQFKHLGVFPEQQYNWEFVEQNLSPGDRFLNLFGYTGAVSLVARSKGADVFHIDSVKQIIAWGKDNMNLSGLTDIHWVLEDAMKFAAREVKRGRQYKGIIMDPPAFGLGANKERWKIEDKIGELLKLGKELLEPTGFLIVNTYSPRLNLSDIQDITSVIFPEKQVEIHKLAVESSTKKVLEYGEITRIV